jgi:hypothetical protein
MPTRTTKLLQPVPTPMAGALRQIIRQPAFRPAAILLIVLSLVPAVYIGNHVAAATRDVAYWDELDTAVQLVLHLDSGLGARDFFSRIFALSNEHRMVTSRLLFAASYWLTGTVNFAVIGVIGNAMLVLLCVLLLYAAGTAERRVRLGLVLAMLLFQLQHYENLLWAGSSIDHFQVVTLAAATVIGVARGNRPGLVIAALCAVLATFTLAHGIVTWVVGGGMLVQARRFQHLKLWGAIAVLAIAAFLAGFHVNHSQRFAELSLAGAIVVVRYWLATLGSVPGLGHNVIAPWLGAVLLVALGWVASRGAMRSERVAFPLACYAILALALIAVGRAAESNGLVHSRYYVLGGLAWALTIFMLLEHFSSARLPYAVTLGCAPLLVAFNVVANRTFAQKADSWFECRDRAALRFIQHGVDGRGPFTLYPAPERSTQLLTAAEQRGVYRLGRVCDERTFSTPQPSSRIAYFVEDIAVNGRVASVIGWAAIPGIASRRGQVHVVLRSGESMHVFTTVAITRPDVAEALKHPECVLAGFGFAVRRDELPTGEFQLGFLFKEGGRSEYIMTGHRLNLVGEGKALLATSE